MATSHFLSRPTVNFREGDPMVGFFQIAERNLRVNKVESIYRKHSIKVKFLPGCDRTGL
jgi:hypothetical protein